MFFCNHNDMSNVAILIQEQSTTYLTGMVFIWCKIIHFNIEFS